MNFIHCQLNYPVSVNSIPLVQDKFPAEVRGLNTKINADEFIRANLLFICVNQRET